MLAVLREALTNVVRHATASAVDVDVVLDESLTLRIADNGSGIDPNRRRSTIGYGLRNLEIRARARGGTCSVRPRDSGGTAVEWQVPLELGVKGGAPVATPAPRSRDLLPSQAGAPGTRVPTRPRTHDAARDRGIPMFVRDFIHIAQPFENVAPRFVTRLANASPRRLLRRRALRRRHRHRALRNRSRPGAATRLADRPDRDGRRPPKTGCRRLVADLEISPLGPEQSQLTLSAIYRRPEDTGADAVMAQRAVEAGVRRFLQALAASLDGSEVTR